MGLIGPRTPGARPISRARRAALSEPGRRLDLRLPGARSRNVLETLDKNFLRKRLAGGTIRRAVFKISFPDDRRGKRVELSGTNKVKFKRATHAEEVFRYLVNWGVVLA